MALFLLGLILFFGPHFYSAFRPRGVAGDLRLRLGEGPYMGLYSLIALAGLASMVFGWRQAAPGGPLYDGFSWSSTANVGLAWASFVLVAAAYMPTGFLKAAIVHPMVLGVAAWAGAHLAAGPSARGAVLFGAFLLFAVIDLVAVSARPQAAARAPRWEGDALAIITGTAGFLVFVLWAHARFFGVSPGL